ncbi:MAG: lysylphosphatidylglycerol synthase transmembrane domain-containing protein [Bacilli bacterium]
MNNEEKKQKHKKKLKNILNIGLIFLFSFGVIFLIIKDDFVAIVETVRSAKWAFIIMGVAFQALQQLDEGVIIMVLSRHYRKDYTFKEGFVNNLVGLFFSFITPSATGGQFAQAYVFTKQDIKVEQSASLMIINFIAYEMVLVLYCILTISLNFNFLTNTIGSVNLWGWNANFLIIAGLGFVVNLASIAGILFLSYSKVAGSVIRFFVKILAKIKIVKNLEYRNKVINQKIVSFRRNLSDIRRYWRRFLFVLLLTFIKMTIYFIAPFFVALALGVNIKFTDIFTIITLASIVTLVATFVPIPGASGGAEFFFYLMFAPIFIETKILSAAMILWRTITFYIPLVYTSLATIVFNRDRKINMLDTIPSEYQWFFSRHMTDRIMEAERYVGTISEKGSRRVSELADDMPRSIKKQGESNENPENPT